MRKLPRKTFLENVAIFKRDAKAYELGQFDLIEQCTPSIQQIRINGGLYMIFVSWDNKKTLTCCFWSNFNTIVK